MMYHFMFGLRGASLVAVAPSVLDGCSPPAAWFFSSSCMIKFKLRPARSVLLPEIAVQKCDAALNHVVDHEKIDAENEYRDHNHRSCGTHFFQRRCCDLAHLAAHVAVKRLDPLRPGLQPVSKIVARACD